MQFTFLLQRDITITHDFWKLIVINNIFMLDISEISENCHECTVYYVRRELALCWVMVGLWLAQCWVMVGAMLGDGWHTVG